MDDLTKPGANVGPFPSTLWTQILVVQGASIESKRAALNRLLQVYWRPLYASIRYGWNKSHEDAKDLAQSFLTSLLEREFWTDVDPSQGKFRSYLRASLKNFMLNEARDQVRLKRGAGTTPVALDELKENTIPATAGKTPDDALDAEWIRTVLSEAIQTLQKEYAQEGKAKHHGVLTLYYLAPRDEKPPTYPAMAQQLGITEADVRYYLHEVRTRLRAKVVDVVRDYAADERDLNEELLFVMQRR